MIFKVSPGRIVRTDLRHYLGGFEGVRGRAPRSLLLTGAGPPRSQLVRRRNDGLAFAPGLDLILAQARALALACWNSASVMAPLLRRSTS